MSPSPRPCVSIHARTRRATSKQPGEGESDLRRRLHARLDDMCDAAEADRLFGEIGLIVMYESGRITHARRHFNGMDK